MKFLNAIFLLSCLWFQSDLLAQVHKNNQVIKAEVDKAMKIMDSLKNSSNPAVAAQAKKLGKMMAVVKQQQDQATQIMDSYTNKETSTLPTTNPLHHIDAIANTEMLTVQSIAKNILHDVSRKLDLIAKGKLDKMIHDTAVNVSGTAIVMMTNGASKYAGAYLIANDVLLHPNYPWKVNDMGALLRDDGKLKEALQCFMFANSLVTSVIIQNNIGWAAFYYGDFKGAKTYFDLALKTDPYFRNALEGRALIAFQEGDIQALYACLEKEITDFGGITGLMPSEPFEDVWAKEAGKQNNINLDNQPDPTVITTFDHVAQDEPEQNSPPGADEEPIDYPNYKAIFDYHPGNMMAALGAGMRFKVISVPKDIQDAINRPNALKSNLPPLVTKVEDSSGVKIVKKNFKMFVDLYTLNEELFERRVIWHNKKCQEALKVNGKNSENTSMALRDRLMQAAKQCGASKLTKENCAAIICPIKVAMGKQGIADATYAGLTWMNYFTKLSNECQWFIKSSSHFITRVHEQRWNHYLNVRRECMIRRAILTFYNDYVEGMQQSSGMFGYTDAALQNEECPPTEARVISNGGTAGADPYSKKIKKIQTFVEPCYSSNTDIGVDGILVASFGCVSDKFVVGSGLKAFVEHVHDKKFVGDNFWHTGVSVGISKSISQKQELGPLKAGAEAKAEVEATVFYDFDNAGKCFKKGVSLKGSVGAEAGGSAGNIEVKEHYGVEAGIEVYTQLGQNAPAGYQSKITGSVSK